VICPKCWTEKAYYHLPQDSKSKLLSWLFMVPMKCHHCYHKFHVLWFFTIGRRIHPPVSTRSEETCAKPRRAA
jgi:hypothetical protein